MTHIPAAAAIDHISSNLKSHSRWVGSWWDSCTHGDMRQTYINNLTDPQCPTQCPQERFPPKIKRSGQRFLQPADGLTRCRWQLGEAAHPKACQAAGSCEFLLCGGARRNGGPSSAEQVRSDWHFALVCLAQPSLASCQSSAHRWCWYLVEIPQLAPLWRMAFDLFIF